MRSVGRVDVVDRAVAVRGVVGGGRDVGDRVVDVRRGAGDVVRLEGGVDDLHQALGGDALHGVGVPVVDGVGVAGGLAHQVLVDALVGGRDALLVQDLQRLLDPGVDVAAGLGGGGGRGGRGADDGAGHDGGAGCEHAQRDLLGLGHAGELLGHRGDLHVVIPVPSGGDAKNC